MPLKRCYYNSMTSTAEKELGHIVKRAEDGHITARSAITLAVRQGYLAVGTAISQEGYVPGVPLTAGHEGHLVGWRPRVTTERGGTFPVMRAGRVAETVVWAALGGDVNEPFQRLRHDRLIIPGDRTYDLGTYGWEYDEQTGAYKPLAHPDLIQATRDLPPDEIIGDADLIRDDGSFGIQIRDEPGHIASTHSHETVATLPVRGGDAQALLGSAITPPLHSDMTPASASQGSRINDSALYF